MDTKINEKEMVSIDTAIAYAQLAIYTLQNSGTEITSKELGREIKMLHKKFGTKEVKRLALVLIKKVKIR